MAGRSRWIVWAVGLAACSQPPGPAGSATTAMPAGVAAAGLLRGSATPQVVCQTDADCGRGGSGGVCMLATCYGLLNAPNRAARRTVALRLQGASLAVRGAAAAGLQESASDSTASLATRLGAIEGAGAVLLGQPRVPQSDGLYALLQQLAGDANPQLAAAARITLAAQGDPAVLPDLLEDLQEGTELLRLEVIQALAGLHGTTADGAAKSALLERLGETSPVVQGATVLALQPWKDEAGVRTALLALSGGGQGRAPHLTYTVDRLLGEGP